MNRKKAIRSWRSTREQPATLVKRIDPNSISVRGGQAPQVSCINQHARIEQALRVERLLGGAQRGEQRRALAVVPRAMIAPDRVVMRDGAAVLDHGVERGALDDAPLFAELAGSPSAWNVK